MIKIWNYIEKILHTFLYEIVGIQLSESSWNKIMQFIKFGLVGMVNNIISYGVYILLVSINMHYVLANIIGFSASVFNAYYWNNKYVFKDTSGYRVWWKTFIKTYISYAGTGIVFSNILLFIWIEFLHIPQIVAPIINVVVMVPINFLVNKYWAYKVK